MASYAYRLFCVSNQWATKHNDYINNNTLPWIPLIHNFLRYSSNRPELDEYISVKSTGDCVILNPLHFHLPAAKAVSYHCQVQFSDLSVERSTEWFFHGLYFLMPCEGTDDSFRATSLYLQWYILHFFRSFPDSSNSGRVPCPFVYFTCIYVRMTFCQPRKKPNENQKDKPISHS